MALDALPNEPQYCQSPRFNVPNLVLYDMAECTEKMCAVDRDAKQYGVSTTEQCGATTGEGRVSRGVIKHIRKTMRSRLKTGLTLSDQRLGINIMPSEIRLGPRVNGLYSWTFLPGKEAFLSSLFEKSLSDHSVSTYRLYAGRLVTHLRPFPAYGHLPWTLSYRSIISHALVSHHSGPSLQVSPEPSVSAMVEQLNEEIARFSQTVCEGKEKAGGG